MKLNLAHTLRRSAANGPGERFVLWVQGCPLACPGCWNPDTWAFKRRDLRDVDEVAEEILGVEGIEGVTFTGGEPFTQARSLARLGGLMQARGLSVFIFTGYEAKELVSDGARELLSVTDVLVTGRFVMAERAETLPWRGSANQEVLFLTGRYGPSDMARAPLMEVRVGLGGGISFSGFPAPEFLRELDAVIKK